MSELVDQKHEVILALAAPPLQSPHQSATQHHALDQIIGPQPWNALEEVELGQDLSQGAHISDQLRGLERRLEPIEVARVDREGGRTALGLALLEERLDMAFAPPPFGVELVEVTEYACGLAG